MADIEKLKAQSEANNELRQLFSEKFSRIDEEIGELRNMMVDREKDIQALEVKATKATDLVNEVQPEKLMVETKKLEAKIESFKSKLESGEQINETIMEELKQVRNQIRTFRGVEEIEKMTKDLLDDQTVIKKIEGKIEHHSDKVESMFMEINKKYDEFKHFKKQTDDTIESFNEVSKKFEEFKMKFNDLASKEDFDDFTKKVSLIAAPLEGESKEFRDMLSEFKDIKGEVIPIISTVRKMEDYHERASIEFENFRKEISEKLIEKEKDNEKLLHFFEKQNEAVQSKGLNQLEKVNEKVQKLINDNNALFYEKLEKTDLSIDDAKEKTELLSGEIKNLKKELLGKKEYMDLIEEKINRNANKLELEFTRDEGSYDEKFKQLEKEFKNSERNIMMLYKNHKDKGERLDKLADKIKHLEKSHEDHSDIVRRLTPLIKKLIKQVRR